MYPCLNLLNMFMTKNHNSSSLTIVVEVVMDFFIKSIWVKLISSKSGKIVVLDSKLFITSVLFSLVENSFY